MLWVIINIVLMFFVVKTGLRMYQFVLSTFVYKEWPDYAKRYGKDTWAVITGATAGIGLEWSKAFAKRGLNICLVSRSEEKLKNVADMLRKENPKIKVRYVAFDFAARVKQEDYEELYESFKDIEVSILVNNVGVGNFLSLAVLKL